MFVIITYDVGTKRVQKMMKTCRKYLTHIQRSVFERMITEGKLNRLKKELQKIMVEEEDSCRIYKIESLKYTSTECLGLNKQTDNIL